MLICTHAKLDITCQRDIDPDDDAILPGYLVIHAGCQ